MTREEFVTLAARGPVLQDGATGSNLMLRGRSRGVCAEQWALEHPDIVIALQTEYVQAGSQIIYAPTFGANRVGLGMMTLPGTWPRSTGTWLPSAGKLPEAVPSSPGI